MQIAKRHRAQLTSRRQTGGLMPCSITFTVMTVLLTLVFGELIWHDHASCRHRPSVTMSRFSPLCAMTLLTASGRWRFWNHDRSDVVRLPEFGAVVPFAGTHRMRSIMAAFLSTQLDFIFFFYGLAFILLGATCFAIAGGAKQREPWTVLGLFASVHGASEWLDLTALVIGDTPVFEVARIAIMTGSFVFLTEFFRHEAIQFGLKLPGRWIYIPILLGIAAGGFASGLPTAGALARYSFGFVGAMGTSWVFVRHAGTFSGTTKRLAIFTAIGFALYAVAAGLIVPAASLWPARVFNHTWFIQTTGVPIQLVRGLLACWVSFSIWAIWGQKLIAEVSSPNYTLYLRKQFMITLVSMAIILVSGWVLTEFLGGIYKRNVQEEARVDIDLLASRLASETATVEAITKMLAGSPAVVSLLASGSLQGKERVKSVVDLSVEASGAEFGMILDGSGTIVASSGSVPTARSSAPTYSSAAYFQASIAGDAGYHFTFDAAGRVCNYYASYPVRGERGTPIGVAVIKKNLGAFEADLKLLDRPSFFIDPDGIVMATNHPNMLLRTLWPLSAGRLAELTRQIGAAIDDRPLLEREIEDSTWTVFGGEREYVRRRYANHSQWSLVILKPTRELFANRVFGIVVTLLITIIVLIYLFSRERWIRDEVQLDRRLKLQQLANDLRFQATTDTLTGLSNRLKFNEALAYETSMSNRYKMPLSLVMFDIDRFKAINDTYGHQIGDKILIQMSRFILSNIRSVDLLARWGGEEFIILMPGSDGHMAYQAAEKLRDAIDREAFDEAGTVTCSFGVTQYVIGESADAFITRADNALYRAKVDGRNQVVLALQAVGATSEIASVA
ncbi:sensor domain-containing diguanylate cyclase [Blastochloris viridis]|uniref:diguanylate cyclase n=1 Tax=Blastochloris viridis TaxID=1079 RepID=A0A182D314_BLAVI|nr:sensor domain-containing diguanylate cyclase [Blastochloris viridis]BAR99839.1 diguanylate cyclase/phosphodiesterase with PAS/PAC sensor [Blastochloris viridis]